jgi:hypothetical protein
MLGPRTPCRIRAEGGSKMKHLSFLVLTLLCVSPTIHAQTAPTDSDTLKALLAEVRQLRHDLQATTVAAQRGTNLDLSCPSSRIHC